MSVEQPLTVDYRDWTTLLPNPPLLNSFQSGWNNIQLTHFRHLSFDVPEIINSQHIVLIPGSQAVDWELVTEGHSQSISYREQDFTSGCIDVFPANLPIRLRSRSTGKAIEVTQCFLEPSFLTQVAHESVNSDRVELGLAIKKADLLLQRIGLALKASLEEDGFGSRFYADSMAVSLAAHLLRHYCHLFKRSTGLSPHQFLIRQRVEQAKRLLKQPARTVTSVAINCGFANQSHFARCFRQYTGMNPNQFRKS